MAVNIGLVGPYDFDGVIKPDFFTGMRITWFDQYPLVALLPEVSVSGVTVKAIDDAYRPNSTAINDANGTTNSATSLVVADASTFLPGDVLDIESEKVLVTAVNATSNTLTITRGHASTTAAAHNNGVTAYLVANSRTGSEVDQESITRVFDSSLTYPQTIQHPYQIGGSTEASAPNMGIPGGFASMVGYQRAKAAQEVMRDFERACCYGKAVALAADTTRPAMNGLISRLTTNRATSPTNSNGYKPSDFVRDVMTAPASYGGKVDTLLLSNEYRNAFAIWGLNLTQVRAGDTSLGNSFTRLVCEDLAATVYFCPLLRPYTAIGLQSNELYMAWKRRPFDKPRGSRGDATEGDVIGEGTIVVNNESHHSFVTGVTAFAKQS
jgi:hypothetical protein